MTKAHAIAKAYAAGATPEDIDREAEAARRLSPTVRNNVIEALSLHPWNNTAEEWARLAGALSR